MNPINHKLIRSFFDKIVFVPQHCAEVRCFNSIIDPKTKKIIRSKGKTTVSGWFTRSDELTCELSRIEGVSAYITVNPVSLSRRPLHAKNTLKVLESGQFCTDQDITVIRYVIIDIDPVRLQAHSKINSTKQELQECIKVRDEIMNSGISDYCYPGISGNGAFLLVQLKDREIDDSLREDISAFTNGLSSRYSNKFCTIDVQTRNPSRPLPIPGTWKFRDPVSTHDRPHRMVEIDMKDHSDDQKIRSEAMAEGSSRSTSF